MCMHPDEKIRNIHERVKYLKRDRKLEAGYMTMEEYIREEAERRAKLMAPSIAESMAETLAKPMAESMGGDACGVACEADGGVTCSVKSSTEYIVISSRAWNNSGRTAAAHRRRTG